jgi:hypothetical protein
MLCSLGPVVLLGSALAALCLAEPARVKVPVGSTFISEAWGFPDGGPAAPNATGRLVVIVDLDGTDAAGVSKLRANGHIVQCYFSVGTVEDWRPDVSSNKAAWAAVSLGLDPNWNERWLDLRNLPAVEALMLPRFQRAAQMGCMAIEADNVDCYDSTACQGQMPGKSRAQVYAMQVSYNQWQLTTAHGLGMSLSLKNAMELLADLPDYDFAVNEQCNFYQECSTYASLLAQDKAVFNIEYIIKDVCSASKASKISTARCNGSNDAGLCSAGGNWVFCDAAQVPLPAVQWTDGSTSAPVAASHAPSRRPTATRSPSVNPLCATPTELATCHTFTAKAACKSASSTRCSWCANKCIGGPRCKNRC